MLTGSEPPLECRVGPPDKSAGDRCGLRTDDPRLDHVPHDVEQGRGDGHNDLGESCAPQLDFNICFMFDDRFLLKNDIQNHPCW